MKMSLVYKGLIEKNIFLSLSAGCLSYVPRQEKSCFRELQPGSVKPVCSATEPSYNIINFVCCKFRYINAFLKANNKCADQNNADAQSSLCIC